MGKEGFVDYLDCVRELPLPSSGQVEAFVRHVAEAENWLKTTPFEGGAPVIAALDPNAGARINAARGGGRRFGIETLQEGAELLHGSELPTARYRERFGFLAYWTDLGAGTAAVEGDVLRRARLPGPGVVHEGDFVPLPESWLALACHPGALLHATFQGAQDAGGWRRFRFAVERLPKLEGARADHPLVRDIERWHAACRAEDETAFAAWLQVEHAELPSALDADAHWQRYIVWRDSDACTALHHDQDERFRQSDIPERVVRSHHDALQCVHAMINAVLEKLRAAR